MSFSRRPHGLSSFRSSIEGPSGLPPLAQPFGRLQAGFLWIALCDSGAFLSVNHIPPLPIPHGLEYPLGSRMHLGVVHLRLEARQRPFPRSPRSRSRVNLRVLRPLTRGPQGQPSPLRTPHGRPGVQGILPTSRGQAPDGSPMVYHSMATGLPIPRGCCLAFSASLPIPCPVPLRHIPSPAQSPLSVVFRCLGAVLWPVPHPCPSPVPPSQPSSRVYTPTGRQQPHRAHRILIHPWTVSCSLHGSLLSTPLLPRTRRALLHTFLSGLSGHCSYVMAPLAHLCFGTRTQRDQAAVA